MDKIKDAFELITPFFIDEIEQKLIDSLGLLHSNQDSTGTFNCALGRAPAFS